MPSLSLQSSRGSAVKAYAQLRQCPASIRLTGLGEFRGRECVFHAPFTVGRMPLSDIVLQEPQGNSASRRHAHLWHDGLGWWVADQKSTNGTYVNGKQIDTKGVGPLQKRDIIQFAKAAFVVESASPTRLIEVDAENRVPSPWPALTGGRQDNDTIDVGPSLQCGTLSIYPLFSNSSTHVDYALSKDAMTAGFVTVSEVSEGGSVPHLKVENRSTRRVLFLEGEELRGGKQNRILNGSALIPANSAITVPVSCVERGRWRHLDGRTVHGGTICSSRLRHALRSSVTRSLSHDLGHDSNQGKIWDEVQSQHDTLHISSATASMTDTMTCYERHVTSVLELLPYQEGSTGLAVAIGSKIVSVDLFNSPSTCERVWNALLSGVAIDGLMSGVDKCEDELDQLLRLLAEARSANWSQVQGIGEGAEHRTEFGNVAGTSLALNGVLVHGSLVTR
jgi:pSer/pThr/pTyr-binding forkhead associated (FHA) protein